MNSSSICPLGKTHPACWRSVALEACLSPILKMPSIPHAHPWAHKSLSFGQITSCFLEVGFHAFLKLKRILIFQLPTKRCGKVDIFFNFVHTNPSLSPSGLYCKFLRFHCLLEQTRPSMGSVSAYEFLFPNSKLHRTGHTHPWVLPAFALRAKRLLLAGGPFLWILEFRNRNSCLEKSHPVFLRSGFINFKSHNKNPIEFMVPTKRCGKVDIFFNFVHTNPSMGSVSAYEFLFPKFQIS